MNETVESKGENYVDRFIRETKERLPEEYAQAERELALDTYSRVIGPVSVDVTEDSFTINQDGVSVKLLESETTIRVAREMWTWVRNARARMSTYGVDQPDEARDIVNFWERGTASNFESLLIQTYLAGDNVMKNRIAFAFPALAQAIDEWKGRHK